MKIKNPNLFGKIYKWHSYIGLITVIPVILWTLSGFMHPFLSHWFKPLISREFIAPVVIIKDQLQIPLHKALEANNIDAATPLLTREAMVSAYSEAVVSALEQNIKN
jgi:hypothetical protein